MPRVSPLPIKPAGQPTPLDAALAEAEQVLQERARLFKILTSTHTSIPCLLADRIAANAAVAGAEVGDGDRDRARACLQDVERELEAARRGRAGAVAALEGQEQDLSAALACLESAQTAYSASIISDFEEKYRQALQQFLAIWHQGVTLSQVLRRPVHMDSPVRVSNLGRAAYLCEKSTTVERVLPDDTSLAVDPTAEKIGRHLDELGSALNYCRGLSSARSRHRPNLDSNLPFSPNGVFLVRREFNDPLDALPYAPGCLIDHTLIDIRQLQRLTAVKVISLEATGTSGQSSTQAVA